MLLRYTTTGELSAFQADYMHRVYGIRFNVERMWVLTSHTEQGRAYSREYITEQEQSSLVRDGVTITFGPQICSSVPPVSKCHDGVWEFVSSLGQWIITIFMIQWHNDREVVKCDKHCQHPARECCLAEAASLKQLQYANFEEDSDCVLFIASFHSLVCKLRLRATMVCISSTWQACLDMAIYHALCSEACIA